LNKYLKAISTNLIFFAISSLAYLIIIPLSIRAMGDEFFGLWSIILAIEWVAHVGSLGIGLIVNKLASENNHSDSETSSIISSALLIILPAAFISIFILFVSRNTLVNYINPPLAYLIQFKYALTIYGFAIIPEFVNEIFHGYFLSQLENKFVKTINLITFIFPWIGAIFISIFV